VNGAVAGLSTFQERQAVLETEFGGWALVLLGLVALAVVVLAWFNLRQASARRRWTLLGLRTGLVLVALAMLVEPAIRRQEVIRLRNVVPVLVDRSASMALRDGPGQPTRADAVRQWLIDQRAAMEELAKEHELRLYTFDAEVEPASSGALVQDEPPAGRTTRTLEALEEVVRRSAGQDLGGLVLVSDGADHGLLGERLVPGEAPDDLLRERVAALGAPVHAFSASARRGLVDLSVERVVHDDFAFVHNALEVTADLRAAGAPTGPLTVTLSEDGAPLQSREVDVQPGRERYRVRFSFTPARIGRRHYRVQAPVLKDETLLVNNQRDFVIRVLRDRVRVLQVSGQPSWDERFLRELLKGSANLDLISFFILRTSADLASVPSNELSLIPFPVEELFQKELPSFDLVILQNFDYRPYRMRHYLPRIRSYVLRGGALLVVGGPMSLSAGGYAGTPLTEVLPVRIPPAGGDAEMFALGRLRPVLTQAGRRHPVMALSRVAEENQAIWSRLPSLEGANRVEGLAGGAVVLAHGRPERGDGELLPLVVAGTHGQGRSLAVLTDTTWRWTLPFAGQGGDLRPYNRFWANAMRWLIRDPDQKLLRVSTDAERYSAGAQVRAEARVVDRAYRPAAGATVTLTRRLAQGADARGEPSGESGSAAGHARGDPSHGSEVLIADDEGRVVWTVPSGAAGVWELQAQAEVGGELLEDTTIYLSGEVDAELREVAGRPDLLEQLARSSGGELHTFDDSLSDLRLRPAQVLRVRQRDSRPLWSHPLVLLLALGLAAGEWWLRQRWGFL